MGAFDRMYLIETILETFFVAIQVSFVVSRTMETIYVLMRFVLVWHGLEPRNRLRSFDLVTPILRHRETSCTFYGI